MRISDWSSDVCSSDLRGEGAVEAARDVVGEREYALYRARRAPIDDEGTYAPVREPAEKAPARHQVEDVPAVDQRRDDEQRHAVFVAQLEEPGAAVAPERPRR